MNRQTLEALNRINRRFYRDQREAFSRTRQRPWPGWGRITAALRDSWKSDAGSRVPSILDVGCGNGRFGRFLSDNLELPFDYLGFDYDLGLLLEARRELATAGSNRRWFAQSDVVLVGLGAAASACRADLVTALGLLHHVPSFERRLHLARELAARLAPGGVLALSFWQFGSMPRFHERRVPWREYNRRSGDPISLVDLEQGDTLLAWGPESMVSGSDAQDAICTRYCHFTDPPEAARLVAGLGCEVLESFRSDGKTGDLNLYYLLRSLS